MGAAEIRYPVRDFLIDAIKALEASGIENARLDAQLLLAQALGVSRTSVLAETYSTPTAEQLAEFARLVSKRVQRIPLAYLRGTQEFYGLTFDVAPAVLIPRPETELLVEFALEKIIGKQTALLADVGTGSGCIAVSVVKMLPGVRAVATDISQDALMVAQRNAVRHGVSDRLQFVRTDTLTGVSGPFDLILSNPPYISTAEIAGLQPEVRDAEPLLALDGGHTGLEVFEKLIAQAARLLHPGGWLAFETAMGQAPEVAELMRRAGFTEVATRQDLAGIERIVYGHQSSSLHV